MAENTAFSASGADIIAQTIELEPEAVPENLQAGVLDDFYDIDRTVHEIVRGNYKRVALQFPDEMLRDSVPIFRRLKARLENETELYVLADTSYGSCCVDEVAAQHVDADAMVHYGHACMSQTSRLPVIYVFGMKELDVDNCADCLVKSLQASSIANAGVALLRFDVAYAHRMDAVAERLRSALSATTELLYYPTPLTSYPSQSLSPLELQDSSPSDDKTSARADNASIIFYVGGESLGLTNLLMTRASCEVHSYDPKTKTARIESTRTNRLLMRRYAVVQRARDADVFGILVGTLGVSSYLPLISHLRSLLSKAHKKSYTISVGKLNPAKLANFPEIECFVLVACPENSVIDAKEFLQPIVTPYELEVALQAEQTWTGEYVLNFDQLLAQRRDRPPSEGESEEPDEVDEPVFSLITGRYRHAKRYGESAAQNDNDPTSSAVILRHQDNTVAKLADSAAGEFLQTRSFQGLEARIGEDLPAVLEQGRSGIARGYTDDHR